MLFAEFNFQLKLWKQTSFKKKKLFIFLIQLKVYVMPNDFEKFQTDWVLFKNNR